MSGLIHPKESYRIMGACFEVYNRRGYGFLEPVYQECLKIELTHCDIPFAAKRPLTLTYREEELENKYEPDFICYEKIIVEIKAVSTLMDKHRAQVFNYLRATRYHLGLLINFGNYPNLEYERIALSRERQRLP